MEIVSFPIFVTLMPAPVYLPAGGVAPIVSVGGEGEVNSPAAKGRGGGPGRSEIDCLARVQVVGDWLLMNGSVGKVFSTQTGAVYSLDIAGQNYLPREGGRHAPHHLSTFKALLTSLRGLYIRQSSVISTLCFRLL